MKPFLVLVTLLVAGLRAVARLIEASRDLILWAPFAVLDAALGMDEFFRLQIQK
ncbi:MAG: hypothetical protein ACKV19_10795 [Verrucomicrobiales bacterium]